ncbi:MAG: iron chaperone [Syntrophothermus sp.]
MPDMKVKFENTDQYISVFPEETKKMLEKLRKAIKQAAPKAEEVISYNMPALKFHGILVYYAAHTSHIGFYPGSAAVQDQFKKELAAYKTSKGTVQFPAGTQIPVTLVKNIVRFRVSQNLEKAASKKKK